jgi:electron transfer flavoprotein alpha subunit
VTANEEEAAAAAAAARRHQPWRVWVVPQLREGRISRVSCEAVAAAQRLAAALGEIDELGKPGAAPATAPAPSVVRVEAVLLGQGLDGAARELAQRDLAAVLVADHAALAAYTPGAWIGVLAPAIAAASPDFVL